MAEQIASDTGTNLDEEEIRKDDTVLVEEETKIDDAPPTGPEPPADHVEEEGEEAEGKVTKYLLLSICLSCFGNAFQYGWHIAIINQPADQIKNFIRATLVSRTGEIPDNEVVTIYYGFGMGAVFVFAGWISSLFSGTWADKFGRKRGMVLAAPIMILSGCLGGISNLDGIKAAELLILARFVAGIHSGLCVSLNSLYLNEIAPKKIRGSVGVIFQLVITFGIMISQIAGLSEILGGDRWPFLFVFTCFPSLACFMLLPLCPESPRYLLLSEKDEEGARKALIALWDTTEVEGEIRRMHEEARKAEGVKAYTLIELIKDKSLRRGTIIAAMLMVGQQLSGVNAVFTYSTQLYELFLEKDIMPYMVVLTGVVNFLVTIPAVPLIEKLGRRVLLIYPTIMALCSFVLMTVFLKLLEDAETGVDSEGVKTYDLDDSTKEAYGAICVLCLMTFIIGFAVGLGPIPFIIVGEIFTQEPRAAAMALATSCNWACNLMVTMLYPTMTEQLKAFANLPFVAFLFITLTFFFLRVPETKGKSYEELAEELSPKKQTAA